MFLYCYFLVVQWAIFLPHIYYAHTEINFSLSVTFKLNTVLAGYNI